MKKFNFLSKLDNFNVFSCLIALVRTSSSMLTKVVKANILALFLMLGDITFSDFHCYL